MYLLTVSILCFDESRRDEGTVSHADAEAAVI